MEGFSDLAMNWRSGVLAGLALAILLFAIALLVRQQNRAASVWLALFLLAAAVNAIPFIIGFAGAYDIWPGLTFLPTDMSPLVGPLLLLHAHALVHGEPAGERKWLFVPGIAYLLYQLWAFTMLGDYRAKWDFSGSVHVPYVEPVVLAVSAGLALYSLWRIIALTRAYRGWLAANRSDDDEFRPTWLTHFIVLMGLLVAAWLVDNLMTPLFGASYFARYWPGLATLMVVLILGVEAWYRLEAPYPAIAEAGEVEEDTPTGRDWAAEGARVRAAVIEQRLFLEPRFTLDALARHMGLNQNYASRAVNEGLQTSFSDFINGLRVEYAAERLGEGGGNVLEVALDAGFNSKASFNRAFKRHTGMTPTQFRAQQASQIVKTATKA